MPPHEKIVQADQRACFWLAKANELREQGKWNTRQYEEAERKAQYWLDRWNTLLGQGSK